jgi:hypothetical protein
LPLSCHKVLSRDAWIHNYHLLLVIKENPKDEAIGKVANQIKVARL